MSYRTLSIIPALIALPLSAQPVPEGAANLPDVTPAFAEQTEAPEQITHDRLATTTIAGDLVHPWGLAILPDGAGYLVTERSGNLRHIATDGTVSDPVANVPAVHAVNQGGLLDVALAPDFADSGLIYLTYAKPLGDGMSVTAASRAVLSDDMTELTNVQEIFEQQPPSPTPMHYGSRIRPTADGMVYITTGEHSSQAERDMSQALAATYGKVIRVNPDGSPIADNPFTQMDAAQPEIYSYGHRNIQGAAIHPETGAFWIIEHGPAGGDELNLVAAGQNYGWPIVAYGQNYNGTPIGINRARHAPDYTEPRYYWDPVIAPGDMVFYQGDMFPEWQGDVLIGGLVAGAVVRLELDGETVVAEERLVAGIGRVRDVDVDVDGSLLILTDYEDGALIRVTPE